MRRRLIISILVAVSLFAHASMIARHYPVMAAEPGAVDLALYQGSICASSGQTDHNRLAPHKSPLKQTCPLCLSVGSLLAVLCGGYETAPIGLWADAGIVPRDQLLTIARTNRVPPSRGPPHSI